MFVCHYIIVYPDISSVKCVSRYFQNILPVSPHIPTLKYLCISHHWVSSKFIPCWPMLHHWCSVGSGMICDRHDCFTFYHQYIPTGDRDIWNILDMYTYMYIYIYIISYSPNRCNKKLFLPSYVFCFVDKNSLDRNDPNHTHTSHKKYPNPCILKKT